jgi:hypothetical protein
MATHYYTRSRRYAFDQEDEGAAKLREMLDDDELDVGDLIACAIEYAPAHKQEGLHEAISGLSEDRRGPRSWARGRLEKRQLSRDLRQRRATDKRLGRDLDPEQLTDRYDRPIEGFGRSQANRDIDEAQGTDRRRMGSDAMAMDGRRSPLDVLRFIQGG